MSTVVLAARVALSAIFLVASYGKLRDLPGSRQTIQNFGLPGGPARVAGVALPVVELVVAVLLIFPPTARAGAIVALLLLLAFIAGIANVMRQGLAPDCHCFGAVHSEPAGPKTLARNALFAVMAVVVIAEAPGPAIDTWVGDRTAAELAAIGLGALALVLGLYVLDLREQRRQMRSDLGRARRFAVSGTPGLSIGSVAPRFELPTLSGGQTSLEELHEGGRPLLLFFMGPGCPSCHELIPSVARWQATLAERLAVAVVSHGDAKANERLFGGTGIDPGTVVLQDKFIVSDAYRIRGTPSAVIVTAENQIGSNPAETVFAIEPLIRLALSGGLERQVADTVG